MALEEFFPEHGRIVVSSAQRTLVPTFAVFPKDPNIAILAVVQLMLRHDHIALHRNSGVSMHDDYCYFAADFPEPTGHPLHFDAHEGLTVPGQEHTFASLKQSILSALWRDTYTAKDPLEAQRQFHFYWKEYAQLVVWHLQLIDARKLHEDGLLMFYAFYRISTGQVEVISTNESPWLWKLYQETAMNFRYHISRHPLGAPRSHAESPYARAQLQELAQSAAALHRSAGKAYAMRRLLAWLLPVSAQHRNVSPYCDIDLFSFDQRVLRQQRVTPGSQLKVCMRPSSWDEDNALLTANLVVEHSPAINVNVAV
ncbi:de-etiolated 1 [Monosiga brevicollis MX1]|uniref:De-etiolated 1 n=1 Tax=Monosiga brevicollis TaxID=81824 RepID=A9UVE8_MONBE|nr:de-etiolated 1 [Monosiga brevicollis MX1]EDQ90567.1 de-etiolated 1 [Monosiga brevicollis MX1]|eukprot:XP_001744618.1 de-etiolated 1 [Monosiga brevicollis MX1]